MLEALVGALVVGLLCGQEPADVEVTEGVLGDPWHRSASVSAGAILEHLVEFDGSLHIWALSTDFDPSLRVEPSMGLRVLEDRSSGGGTTAYLRLSVRAGQFVVMRVSAVGAGSGVAELHWVEAPETEATRVAAAAGWQELAAIKQLLPTDREVARERLVAMLAGFESLEGAGSSQPFDGLYLDAGYVAYELGSADATSLAWGKVHDYRERVLPRDHPDLLIAKMNLATACSGIGDLPAALELMEYVHAARERVLPPEDRDLMRAKRNLGAARYAFGDLTGALELTERVHEVWERLLPPDDSELLQVKSNLAVVRRALGDSEGANELIEYVGAARARAAIPDDPLALKAEHDLAVRDCNSGRPERARERLEAVYAAWERLLPPDHADLLMVKASIGTALNDLGDYEGARELFEYVHAARKRSLPAEHPLLIDVKESLAGVYMQLGRLEQALALMEYVHEVKERSLPPEHPQLLVGKTFLAAILSASGDLEGARELEEYVYAVQKRSLPPEDISRLTNSGSLANTRRALGDPEGALELLDYVCATKRRLLPEDDHGLLVNTNNLAAIKIVLGDFEGALELLEHVHTVLERSFPSTHLDLLDAKANLSIVRRRLGDRQGALELAEHVHAVQKDILAPDHPRAVAYKLILASARAAMGDWEGALELRTQAHNSFLLSLPADHPDLLTATIDLAETRRKLGDSDGALDMTLELLEVQARLGQKLGLEAPRVARATVRRELARLSRAICSSRAPDSETSPARALAIFAALEGFRAVSIDSMDVALACAADPDLEALRRAVAAARRRASDAALSAPSDARSVELWRGRLVELAQERDRLQRELRKALESRGLRLEAPTAQRVAAGLAAGEAFLGFLRYRDQDRQADGLLAVVVTPDARAQIVELGACAELEALALEWRALVGKPIDTGSSSRAPGVAPGGAPSEQVGARSVEASGRALRARLLDPCLAVLSKQTLGVLHVVPDDFLLTVPLDALPGEDGRLVGETIDLCIEVSARRIVTPRAPASEAGVLLALGGIDYDAEDVSAPERRSVFASAPVGATRGGASASSRLVPLAQTKAETRAVGQLFERYLERAPVILAGAAATKRAFIEHAGGARFVHIATHGWFAPPGLKSMLDAVGADASPELELSVDRAERSVSGFLPEALCGLAFAGANQGADQSGRVPGILTAEELATVDLRNCELAVLSACETNVGIRRAGQGIQSLQASLHAAGVRTAITSLWKVDDAATRHLMELFYANLWEHELGKAQALWAAKMTLRSEGAPLQHWAGWVLTGDPD